MGNSISDVLHNSEPIHPSVVSMVAVGATRKTKGKTSAVQAAIDNLKRWPWVTIERVAIGIAIAGGFWMAMAWMIGSK